MKYFPITPNEVALGAARMLLPASEHPSCTVPVRQPHEYAPGQFSRMMAYGSPRAYEVVAHNGKLYAISRHDDAPEFLE